MVTLVSLSGISGVTELSSCKMVASGLLGVSVTGTPSRSPDSWVASSEGGGLDSRNCDGMLCSLAIRDHAAELLETSPFELARADLEGAAGYRDGSCEYALRG